MNKYLTFTPNDQAIMNLLFLKIGKIYILNSNIYEYWFGDKILSKE